MTTLAELEMDYIECRGPLRHRWDRIPDDGGAGRKYKESRSVARIQKRCERCGTVRYEAWNRITAEILFVNYRHPDGYKITRGKVKPYQVRKEYLKRFNEQVTVHRPRRAKAS